MKDLNIVCVDSPVEQRECTDIQSSVGNMSSFSNLPFNYTSSWLNQSYFENLGMQLWEASFPPEFHMNQIIESDMLHDV